MRPVGRTRRDAGRWFVELLLKNPERPPPGRPVEMLLKEGGRAISRRRQRCPTLL